MLPQSSKCTLARYVLSAIGVFLLFRYIIFSSSDESRDVYTKAKGKVSSVYKSNKRARRLSADELLSRPITEDVTKVPKLLHQSWKSSELPDKFLDWSNTCRGLNSDWEWVLWTNEDNKRLVEMHFPWFLETYNNLKSEIYRADVARNMYMFVFGGVYMDLDTDCLRPLDGLFDEKNLTLITSGSESSSEQREPRRRQALVGRMGTDDGFSHSIPNAWMASTPAHPFWMLPLQECARQIQENKDISPEGLTGPEVLHRATNKYHELFGLGNETHKPEDLDKYFTEDEQGKVGIESYKIFNHQKSLKHDVEVLPFHYIFPYSWAGDGAMFRKYCWVVNKQFDAKKCKDLVAVDRWGSYQITYWSHSWTAEGHDEGHMERLNNSEKEADKGK